MNNINTTFYIVGQVFIVLSYIVFWISRFSKEKKKILLLDTICRLLAIISFLYLKTDDGIKNSIYIIIRNIVGYKVDSKSNKYKIISLIIFTLLLFIMYNFTFYGISTICIIMCTICNSYGTIMSDEQGIRIFGMIGSIFYMLFMILTYNIAGVVCELICFSALLASYLKFKNTNNETETKKGEIV